MVLILGIITQGEEKAMSYLHDVYAKSYKSKNVHDSDTIFSLIAILINRDKLSLWCNRDLHRLSMWDCKQIYNFYTRIPLAYCLYDPFGFVWIFCVIIAAGNLISDLEFLGVTMLFHLVRQLPRVTDASKADTRADSKFASQPMWDGVNL